MDTQAQQLILHFSTRMHATFSAAWSHPGLGQDGLVPPVYSISQVWPSQDLTPTRFMAQSTAGGGSKHISNLSSGYLSTWSAFVQLVSRVFQGAVSNPFSFWTYKDKQRQDWLSYIQLFSGPLKLLPHFVLMLCWTQLSSTTMLLPASYRQLAEFLSLSPNLKSRETEPPEADVLFAEYCKLLTDLTLLCKLRTVWLADSLLCIWYKNRNQIYLQNHSPKLTNHDKLLPVLS